MKHQIKVELSESGHKSRVWLDGKEISSLLRGITIEAAVGQVTRAVLRTTAVEVEIIGEPGELVTEPPD